MTTTKGDCGCHESAAPAEMMVSPGAAARFGVAARYGVADPKPATAPVATPGAGTRSGTGTTVLRGFRGLNPQDGLFLRGEHLAAIQDYSRALTTALATASGTGVVHGLGVAIAGRKLVVSPGLAISPHGRLLLLTEAVSIPLDDAHLPALEADGFWRVELHWAWDNSGSAPSYGSLCADECHDGGSTIRPWRDEGVEIRIVPDALELFGGVLSDVRGNWLSSHYFERERRNGRPWLTPVARNAPVPPLGSHAWTDDTRAPDEQGVPLALVYSSQRASTDDVAYRLQVWTARRLTDGPVAHAAWRSRLAMRPWSIFLAQILQFESEIMGVVGQSSGPQSAVIQDLGDAYQFVVDARDLLAGAGLFIKDIKPSDRGVRRRPEFAEFMAAYSRAAASSLASEDPAPVSEQFGIGELPPAGYLPMNERAEDVERRLQAFFGPNVQVRTRRLRADQVADEVLAAQHRDRIPLYFVDGLPQPKVDVLLPVESADMPQLSTDVYGWVAFVRRAPEPEPPQTSPMTQVGVYIRGIDDLDVGVDLDLEDRIDTVETGLGEPIGVLEYPKGTWAYPRGTAAHDALKMLAEYAQKGLVPFGFVALTEVDPALAALRAGLFGVSLDSAYGHLPVRAYDGRPAEVIAILVAERAEG